MRSEIEELQVELAGGVSLRVLRRGSGPSRCLFLHGNPGGADDWLEVFSLLPESLQLAAVDLPGFGGSDRLGDSWQSLSLERMADATCGLLDALGWAEPVHLIGHSHGGAVAQVTATSYPQRIEGVVLLGSLGSPAPTSYRLLSAPGAEMAHRLFGAMLGKPALRSLNRRLVAGVLRDALHPEPVTDEWIERYLARFTARPASLLTMVHLAIGAPSRCLMRHAAKVSCPVLCLHGARDALVPAQSTKAVCEQMPHFGRGATHETIDGAGHMLMVTHTALLASRISDFVSTHQSAKMA